MPKTKAAGMRKSADRIPISQAIDEAKRRKEKSKRGRRLSAKEQKNVDKAVRAAESSKRRDEPIMDGDMILLSALSRSERTQARVYTDDDVISDYATAMGEGAQFPAIEVTSDGKEWWVTDGWQRVEAARAIGLIRFKAIVTDGTLEDAVFSAIAANRTHGLRRTNRDKAHAVQMALACERCAAMSDRELADHVGVSHEFVRQQRAMRGADADGEPMSDGSADAPPLDDVDASMAKAERWIGGIIEALEKQRKAVTTLIDDESRAGSFVNGNSVDSDMQNAIAGLRCAIPGGRCVYCGGARCKACNEIGWLGRQAMATAPDSLKGGKEGAAQRVASKRAARAAIAKEDDAPQPIGKDRGKRIGPKSKARPPAKAADDKGSDEVPF